MMTRNLPRFISRDFGAATSVRLLVKDLGSSTTRRRRAGPAVARRGRGAALPRGRARVWRIRTWPRWSGSGKKPPGHGGSAGVQLNARVTESPCPFRRDLTMLWPDIDVYDRFRAAAEAGFRRVEILFVHALDAARVEKRCRTSGWSSCSSIPRRATGRGRARAPQRAGREQEFVATVRDAVAAARRFGTKLLNALAGIPPAGVTRAEAERTAIANLRAAVPLAEQAGVTLLVEAINSIDMPGYFADTVERAAALVEGARSPS